MKTSPQLDRYKRFVGEALISRIYQVASSLAGLHVLHVNTTAKGGGVAEILQALLPLMEELGIKHTWKVVPLDDASNHFTAHLVDLLQGNEPGDVPQTQQHLFLDKLRQTPVLSLPEENQADIYFIHDFQLAPLAKLFSWMRPAIWFCHIDTANPNLNAEAYIQQFLDAYKLCAFNSQASVFKDLPPSKSCVITLGIDPFRNKNKSLPGQKAWRR